MDEQRNTSAAWNNSGTGGTTFQPFLEKESASSITNHYLNLCFQPEYHKHSVEELRLADYMENRRYFSAKNIIKDIRIEHGVEESFLRKIAEDAVFQRAWKFKEAQLRNALKELSAGLYTKDTHFVLELIQNADDDRYAEDVEPCLHFTSKSGRIRIDCNELGFEEKNVRAICKIGESTKKRSASTGYIGEKGIGFKSVFKAADIVHIHSGDYSFKFDTTHRAGMLELGMLAPIWDIFPSDELIQNHTQILMELSAKCNINSLHGELKELKPTLLLFLRKLNLIKIDIPNETCKTFSCKNRAGSSNVLITETSSSMGSIYMTRTYEYFVTRHVISDLPQDPKRPGVLTTEIVLAFPLQSGGPHVTKQLVYAFLPLKDFGFKFLVQADFLVPSNREDIQKCAWNNALRDGVIGAFRRAVDKFNTMPRLQYTWLRFLPGEWHSESFLSTLANEGSLITEHLKSEMVLRSRAGTLQIPVFLTYVPEKFLDRRLDPLLGGEGEYQYQLAPQYATEDLPALHRLGVQDMDPATFLRKLAKLNVETLRSKRSPSWHEDLAKSLNGLSYSYRAEIERLPLIPLRNGDWVSASTMKSSPIYFEDGEDDLSVPSGIEIRVVNSSATKNKARKQLFQWLGVKYCSHLEVCTLILESHRAEFRGSKTVDELVSHTAYLYKFRNSIMNLELDHVWLVDSSEPMPFRKRGRNLYIDIPGTEFAVSSFLTAGTRNVAFIHQSYVGAIQGRGQRDWINWLVRMFHVSDIPRIKESGGSTLSLDFRSIMDSSPSQVFLKILTDYWPRYSRDISPLIKKEISSASVDCASGRRPLKETVIRLPDLVKLSKDLGGADLPFLKIEEPISDPNSLMHLSHFDVTTTANIDFYLLVLQASARRKNAKSG